MVGRPELLGRSDQGGNRHEENKNKNTLSYNANNRLMHKVLHDTQISIVHVTSYSVQLRLAQVFVGQICTSVVNLAPASSAPLRLSNYLTT